MPEMTDLILLNKKTFTKWYQYTYSLLHNKNKIGNDIKCKTYATESVKLWPNSP